MIRRLAFSLLALAVVTAGAQQAPVARRLPAATGTLNVEFSSVSSIREIADGRLIIVDSKEQQLLIGDFQTGEVAPLGRQGDGPGEYRYPRVLYSLTGDTTVLPGVAYRWLVLVGDSITDTWSSQGFAVRGFPFALGDAGRVFNRVNGPASCHDTESSRPDTIYVALSSRTRKLADTIGYFLVAPTRMRRATFADGRTASRCTPPVFPPNGDVAAFPNGWIAIARQDPYRVDWRNPVNGVVTRGEPIPGERPLVTERDRQAIIDSFPARPGRMPDYDYGHFPERAPAFQQDALLALPDGRLMIRRTLLASAAEARYDIIDRTSRLAATLTIPRNSRIAGFGKASVYVVTTDADGLQRIARHPWP